MKEKGKMTGILLALIGLLILVLGVCTALGSADIPVAHCYRIIGSRIPLLKNFISLEDVRSVHITILLSVRLPRILLAGIVGCGLAIVGAAFQGLFRNPLADPHILGVSSGAALGATIAILSGVSLWIGSLGFIAICAFAGAIITVFLVYSISGIGGKNHLTSMLLTGTAISTMLSSVISLLMTLNRDKLENVYMWTLGSFSNASWGKIRFAGGMVAVGTMVILMFANDLNVMLTGEDSAKSLGIQILKVKRIIILVSSLLVGACVSVSGIIGFVGLLIPHCTRLLIGPDHKKLLPCCCFIGAIFMMICDTIARCIIEPSELPVGVITALFGAPYFIFLLYYNQRKMNRA